MSAKKPSAQPRRISAQRERPVQDLEVDAKATGGAEPAGAAVSSHADGSPVTATDRPHASQPPTTDRPQVSQTSTTSAMEQVIGLQLFESDAPDYPHTASHGTSAASSTSSITTAAPTEAGPPTHGAKSGPSTRPVNLPGSAQSRSNYAARRVLRRLVQGETPPTAPMSIVERLTGSPYANPMVRSDAVEDSARKTLDFALELAESLFRYGAGALEVETSVIAVSTSFGLRNVDVDINNQSVTINYGGPGMTPITVLRVVRSWSDNNAALSNLHRLVTDITVGDVSRDEAIRRLETITTANKPFPRWAVRLAASTFTSLIVLWLGGSLLAAGISFVSTAIVTLIQQRLGIWRIPEFFTTLACAATIAGLAQIAWVVDVPVTEGIVIAGGLILLLPTMRLVSATQDAINGFPVTAAGRYLSALMIFAAVAAGIAISLVVGVILGVPRLNVDVVSSSSLPTPVLWLLAISIAVLFAVTMQTRKMLLLPIAGIAAGAYLVWLLATEIGLGGRIAPAVASVFIGMAARIIGLRLKVPLAVLAVPAIMFMFPGLTIFQSIYFLAIELNDQSLGLNLLIGALTVILAMAAGIVLGDNLARPLAKSPTERRRRNRRR